MALQRVATLVTFSVLLFSCGERGSSIPDGPVSVRGWIGDFVRSGESYVTVGKLDEAMLRMETFRNANVYVEGVKYASGGIGENGSFLILDVPAGRSRIHFQIPGVGEAAIQLDQIPSNADVVIPAIRMEAGSATIADASQVKVRVPGDSVKPTSITAIVGGHQVKVMQVTVDQLGDRRDFPVPDVATAPKPIAIVK